MTAERAIKEPCRVMATNNIALSGLQTIDGTTLAAGDRVLVTSQTSSLDNGIYVAATGSWTRATDFDASGEALGGALIAITSGTLGAAKLMRVSGSGEPIPGSDPIMFEDGLVRARRSQPLSPKDFGAIGNGSDETAAVQAALDSLDPDEGGIIEVDFDVKFDTTALDFPQRSMLRFRMDSDLATPNPETTLRTNEYVTLIANADQDGFINEDRLTAPFSVGHVVDLRSDIRGHSAFAGDHQDFDDPTVPLRVHHVFAHEQVGTWRTVMERYRHFSAGTGVYQHSYRQVWRLTGVGSAGWTTAPAILDTIEGVTSGARGVVRDVTSGYLDVEWLHGNFVEAEKVRKITVSGGAYVEGAESTGTISCEFDFDASANSYFGTDLYHGRHVCGHMAFGYADEQFNVNGNVKITPSSGQLNTTPTPEWCGLILGDGPERRDLSPNDHNQIHIAYDLGASQTLRRLWMRRKYGSGAWAQGGALVPIDVACVFTHASPNPTIETNSVNVDSILHYTGSGQNGIYVVYFARDLARANFIPQLTLIGPSASIKGWEAIPTGRQVAQLDVEIFDSTGTRANLPSGCALAVEIKLGDI